MIGVARTVSMALLVPLMLANCVPMSTPMMTLTGHQDVPDLILQPEMGMHTAPISAISVDAAGKLVLTASVDKTARLWSLPDGRLLKILRPPHGIGEEGRLDAAALSPDGLMAAVGGVTTGADWDAVRYIYLFDTRTGRLTVRLPTGKKAPSELAFSPDGRFLVTGLPGRGGIMVWRTDDWALVGQDNNYLDNVEGLSFDHSGRLVSVSDDGLIRLYDSSFRLVGKGPCGRRPTDVAISSDGNQIAIRYLSDTFRLDVVSGRNLKLLFSPDSRGTEGHRLGRSVAWSSDGRTLYSSGSERDVGNGGKYRSVLYVWSGGGRSPRRDVTGAGQIISWLAPMLNGGVVFAGLPTSWGTIGTSPGVNQSAKTVQFEFTSSSFRISTDGRTVAFTTEYEVSQPVPVVMSLSHRMLVVTNQPPPDLHAPAMSSTEASTPGMVVTGWRDSAPPLKLNGRVLKLTKEDSFVTPTAVSVRGNKLLVASTSGLGVFDQSSRNLWAKDTSSVPATASFSADGRFVVAAFYDGTVRWYRSDDGQELLALLTDKDAKRWVLWTPSGYYDASPGGEEMVGWHVNRGRDQAADFYPIDQFRERFYRPDVISRVLDTLDEKTAVFQANAAAQRQEPTVSVARILPPVVEVVSAPERFADNTVPVRIRVTAPADAPVTRLRVLVNGEIMPSPRAAEPVSSDGSRDLTLVLPPRDSQVTIFADNRNSTSVPVKLTMKWAGGHKVFAAGEQGVQKAQKPKLWVLAVGVSAYRDPGVPHLSYASSDAEVFADILKAQRGKAYREVEAKVITDSEATRANVLAGLDWIKTQVEPGDVGIVFLAGHGFTMAADHRYYYGSVDVDLNRLTETGVPYKAIQDALIDFNLRGDGTRAIFFIDTCHAGDATGVISDSVKASNGDALAMELTRTENQVLVFASSKGNQSSWEEPQFRHGAFTEALIEGLGEQWQADPRTTGRVTYKNLDAWVSDRVPVITHDRQTPRLMTPPGGVDDFVLGTR